ncbi:MAG: DUF302 domain-containing protein [Thiovulaceae bacterium]|nr:DUF302 domain-containing protein [Sulfurimonadaceae bacterium]
MQLTTITTKTVSQAVEDLKKAVTNNNFSVLHIHDLHKTLNSKGIDFKNECQVLEICNPTHANEVLMQDMSMNMVLPCRISVYQENGDTKIGMVSPLALMEASNPSDELRKIAAEVEATTKKIIEEAV